MRVGPIEVEDWNPDCWRVSVVYKKQHYYDRWFSKHDTSSREALERYIKDAKGIAILPFLKEAELALIFLKVEEDAEKDTYVQSDGN